MAGEESSWKTVTTLSTLQTHAHLPQVYKKFSCSTKLSMKFFLLINVRMPTIDGILTSKSRKNSTLGLPESEKC